MSLLHAVQLIKHPSSSGQVFTVLKEGKRFPFVLPCILNCLINPAGATALLFQLIKAALLFTISRGPSKWLYLVIPFCDFYIYVIRFINCRWLVIIVLFSFLCSFSYPTQHCSIENGKWAKWLSYIISNELLRVWSYRCLCTWVTFTHRSSLIDLNVCVFIPLVHKPLQDWARNWLLIFVVL